MQYKTHNTHLTLQHCILRVLKNVSQSHYRPGVAQRVPES